MWQRDKRIVNRWKLKCYSNFETNNIYAFVEKYKIRKANKAEQSGIRFRRIAVGLAGPLSTLFISWILLVIYAMYLFI